MDEGRQKVDCEIEMVGFAAATRGLLHDRRSTAGCADYGRRDAALVRQTVVAACSDPASRRRCMSRNATEIRYQRTGTPE